METCQYEYGSCFKNKVSLWLSRFVSKTDQETKSYTYYVRSDVSSITFGYQVRKFTMNEVNFHFRALSVSVFFVVTLLDTLFRLKIVVSTRFLFR